VATPQLLKASFLEQWTGGVQGIVITKPDPPEWIGLSQDRWLYFVVLACVLVLFAIAWNVLRGRMGRAMVAIRDQPIAAKAMGIDTAMVKSLTFGISAMYTGIAGALAAVVVQFVAPDSFSISIFLVVGVVIGGLASISGALYGALFLQFIPNIADQISKAAPGAIYGVFAILFMYVMPTGVAGFIRIVAGRLKRRRMR
jgi:branched-chain amino acid transport system permease protein